MWSVLACDGICVEDVHSCRHAPVQITFRAIVVGICLGVAYGFITMRFALGPFGVVPTFNMPMVSC